MDIQVKVLLMALWFATGFIVGRILHSHGISTMDIVYRISNWLSARKDKRRRK